MLGRDCLLRLYYGGREHRVLEGVPRDDGFFVVVPLIPENNGLARFTGPKLHGPRLRHVCRCPVRLVEGTVDHM